ncbi:MAG: hypothetical protein AB7I50_10925 [Vicinamibacterales bacterium]
MPILVRPVREQLEHDRVIRLLQAKWKKQYDVEANVGDERRTSLKIGQMTVFPDLVMSSQTPPKRLQSVAEVETGESVNHLEAMSQWAHMSKARAPFRLYVPVGSIDQARRLCGDHHVALFELWSYYVLGEQVRFTLIQRDRSLGNVGSAKGRGRDDVNYGLEPLETETLGPLELPPPPPPAPEPVVVLSSKATVKADQAAAKLAAKSAEKPSAKAPVKKAAASAAPAASPVASAKTKSASKPTATAPARTAAKTPTGAKLAAPPAKPAPLAKPAPTAKPAPAAKPAPRAAAAKASAKPSSSVKPTVRKQASAPIAARKSAAASAAKRVKDARAPRPTAKLAPKAARAATRRS